MKQQYFSPEAEILKFSTDDIIQTSNDDAPTETRPPVETPIDPF